MFFEDQLEPPGKGAGGHGQVFSVAAEDVVLCGQLSALVEFQLPFTEGAVLFHQAGHLQGEVHIPVPGGRLEFFYRNIDVDLEIKMNLCSSQIADITKNQNCLSCYIWLCRVFLLLGEQHPRRQPRPHYAPACYPLFADKGHFFDINARNT